MSNPIAPSAEQANLLHMVSSPTTFFSTGNVAEAAPGVHTPLGWSIWGGLTEQVLSQVVVALGAWPRPPDVSDVNRRFGCIFYGRYAANVNTFRAFGDRMPGTSGDAVEIQFFGAKMSQEIDHPVPQRYPVVVAKMPWNLARTPRQVAAYRADNYAWWTANVCDRPPAGVTEGLAVLSEGSRRYVPVMRAHCIVTLLAQACYDQLAKLCTAAGMDGRERALVSGYGGMEESAVIADVRELAGGQLGEHEFVRRHGYHGRGEGDVSSHSWREDLAPIRALAESYRKSGADPLANAASTRTSRQAAERELRVRVPWSRRPLLAPTLALTRRFVLAREVGKAGFLLAMDGMRAGARAIGASLAEEGVLDDAENVFFLTLDELLTDPRVQRGDVIAERRKLYDRYRSLDLPPTWQGNPTPLPLDRHDQSTERVDIVSGMGVSPGTAEGTVRVVHDAGDDQADEFEPGDILVCRITDPSWAPLLSVAAAVVIDIGGSLSHGAIVARELGIPCVINTVDGSRRLRTGDRVMVDGEAGTVRVRRL
ncbi:PEP-utilizing enzyme [Mycobacterium sp. Aquia_216]|uniref:PEP-utilizing enzyme n=1 Tax=Mycobacterium sp. Aquia_216 TaxID=2991729 RepID=UPI002279FAAC|nr:PEP-utilizing enzyme [Mycobacterium sp. Aquia_216]WAJ43306.1 PEP-utilizing enzyme [Mycobacterium sp. Aquia_216]